MQTHENVEIPRFLDADFVVQYSGRNVPSVGKQGGLWSHGMEIKVFSAYCAI